MSQHVLTDHYEQNQPTLTRNAHTALLCIQELLTEGRFADAQKAIDGKRAWQVLQDIHQDCTNHGELAQRWAKLTPNGHYSMWSWIANTALRNKTPTGYQPGFTNGNAILLEKVVLNPSSPFFILAQQDKGLQQEIIVGSLWEMLDSYQSVQRTPLLEYVLTHQPNLQLANMKYLQTARIDAMKKVRSATPLALRAKGAITYSDPFDETIVHSRISKESLDVLGNTLFQAETNRHTKELIPFFAPAYLDCFETIPAYANKPYEPPKHLLTLEKYRLPEGKC